MPGGVPMITPAWRLWRIISSVSRFLLSSNAPGVWHAPVVFRFYNHAPTASLGIRYAPDMEVEASASLVLLLLSPSAVRSHGAIKREKPYQGHSIGFSQCSEVSCRCDIFRNVLPLIRCEINVKNPMKKIDISVRISKFAIWMYLKYVLKLTPLGKALTINR